MRALLLRDRDGELRDFRAPLDFFAAGFLAVGLRAADERLAPDEDFDREVLAFFAVLLFAVERLAVERLAADFRAPLLRLEADDDFVAPPELALALPSIVHLPVMTR